MKEEYLIDLNATQAAIRAGYKIDSARDIGCENLRKPQIAEAIEKALAERSRRKVFAHRYAHKGTSLHAQKRLFHGLGGV